MGVLGGGHGDGKGDQHLGMSDDEPASAAGTAVESSMRVNLLSRSSLSRSSAVGEELLLRRGPTSSLSRLIRMKAQEKRI